MKNLYCAECGTQLNTVAKALPQKGIVLTCVEKHECQDVDHDWLTKDVKIIVARKVEGNFVQKLNEVARPLTHQDDSLKDARKTGREEISSAPPDILKAIDNISEMGG